MNWFYNSKTKTKLTLGFGLVITLTLLISALSFQALTRDEKAMDGVIDRGLNRLVASQKADMTLLRLRLEHYRLLGQKTREERAKSITSIEKSQTEVDQYLKELGGTAQTAIDKQLFSQVETPWRKYVTVDLNWRKLVMEDSDPKVVAASTKELAGIAQNEIAPASTALVESITKGANDLARSAKQRTVVAERMILGIAMGALVLSVAIVWFLVNYISKSVSTVLSRITTITEVEVPQLSAAMSGLAEYDLTRQFTSETPEIRNPYHDDFGQLSQCVDSLIVNFRGVAEHYAVLQSNLTGVVTNLQRGSKQVNETSLSLGTATEQTSLASNEIAEGSEKLAGSATEAAAVMERLHQTVREVQSASESQTFALVDADTSLERATATAREMAVSAQQATAVAFEGKTKIEGVVVANDQIRQQVERSTRQVQELHDASSQIVTIVQSIEQIAEQTNLLALNAAIEAARAGEHGRGFAVVAEEVRKLAEGAGAATRQIVGLIDNIQQKVSETVTAINATGPLVLNSSKLSTEAGEALSLIAVAAQRVADNATGVATQSEAVAVSMKVVRNLAEQTAQQTLGMGSGAEEVSGAIQGVAAITEETALVPKR